MFNRHAFDTELSKHLKSSNKGLSLILGDIDHFKAFNDKWGHFLGDQVLKSVGKRFIQNMRNGATDFRFGGEEFAILIPNSNFLFARNFAETLRRSFEKSPLKDKRTEQKINKISVSFGVVECEKGESLSRFIGRADAHLYDAKRLGRNRELPL